MEIELKLVGSRTELPAQFAKLNGGRDTSQRVLSTYYDTPDDRLWRRGFTLSLRDKREFHELTLQQEVGGWSKRAAWTSLIAKPVVDIGLLPQNAPRADIGVILPEEFEPRFFSQIDRKIKVVTTGEAVLEASLDLGQIVAGERTLPVAELEFKLLSGPIADLLAWVRSLLQDNVLLISTQSKASRGMSLLNGAQPPVVKATRPNLDSSDTIDQAVAKVLAVTAIQITGNIAAAADGCDPEGVHQLRVSLRRLRSALLTFKNHLGGRAAHLNDEAKRSLRQLGRARDLDVFLTETLPPVIGAHSDDAGLGRLGDIAEDRRAEAYDHVRCLVGDQRFNRFLLDLLTAAEGGGLVVKGEDEPLLPMARRMLAKRHKSVMKVGKGFAQLTEAQRHEVRIELKKLRYACDYFQTLFPRERTRPYLKRLAQLQDHLGELNDAAVAGQLTEDLAAGDGDAAIGAAIVKGWYSHGLQAVEPQIQGAWRKFTESKPFWRTQTPERQQP